MVQEVKKYEAPTTSAATTSEKLKRPKFDDYLHGLNHEEDDFDPVPEELQSKIRDFSENTFIPDILHYLGTKDPVYYKYPVQLVEIRGFEYEYGILKGCISKEERYDLWKLEDLFSLPDEGFCKIQGRRLVGSAIRICKAINQPEHADTFHKIVEGCFTPQEHQDPKDLGRTLFGLDVEPSTGEIQCNCCNKEQ